jgi:hypothetical protein
MALEIRKEDIRQESVNTTPDQFKVIDDVKDEPTLKEAQDFVGGIVEGIQFPNGDYMIINEEGKLINLPLNVEATLLWRALHLLRISTSQVMMTMYVVQLFTLRRKH